MAKDVQRLMAAQKDRQSTHNQFEQTTFSNSTFTYEGYYR